MIISTTNCIENNKINDYLGVVSGTDIYLVGGILGGGLANQEKLYTQALNNAIEKMERKARDLGANAIVGVSTNIVSPGNLNNIIVIATGTAVVLQKNNADRISDSYQTTPECLREDSFEKQFKYEENSQVIRDAEESFIDKDYTRATQDIRQSIVYKDEDAIIQEASDGDYIDFDCPKCNEPLSFLLCEIGESATCPYCGTEITII